MKADEITKFLAYAQNEVNRHIPGWRLKLNKRYHVLGVCRYISKEILLSKVFLQQCDWAEMQDTLLHEIAHALTPGAGHDIRWQKKAVELGARPERCAEVDIEVPYKWVLNCTCEKKAGFIRKPRAEKYRCKKCKFVGTPVKVS